MKICFASFDFFVILCLVNNILYQRICGDCVGECQLPTNDVVSGMLWNNVTCSNTTSSCDFFSSTNEIPCQVGKPHAHGKAFSIVSIKAARVQNQVSLNITWNFTRSFIVESENVPHALLLKLSITSEKTFCYTFTIAFSKLLNIQKWFSIPCIAVGSLGRLLKIFASYHLWVEETNSYHIPIGSEVVEAVMPDGLDRLHFTLWHSRLAYEVKDESGTIEFFPPHGKPEYAVNIARASASGLCNLSHNAVVHRLTGVASQPITLLGMDDTEFEDCRVYCIQLEFPLLNKQNQNCRAGCARRLTDTMFLHIPVRMSPAHVSKKHWLDCPERTVALLVQVDKGHLSAPDAIYVRIKSASGADQCFNAYEAFTVGLCELHSNKCNDEHNYIDKTYISKSHYDFVNTTFVLDHPGNYCIKVTPDGLICDKVPCYTQYSRVVSILETVNSEPNIGKYEASWPRMVGTTAIVVLTVVLILSVAGYMFWRMKASSVISFVRVAQPVEASPVLRSSERTKYLVLHSFDRGTKTRVEALVELLRRILEKLEINVDFVLIKNEMYRVMVNPSAWLASRIKACFTDEIVHCHQKIMVVESARVLALHETNIRLLASGDTTGHEESQQQSDADSVIAVSDMPLDKLVFKGLSQMMCPTSNAISNYENIVVVRFADSTPIRSRLQSIVPAERFYIKDHLCYLLQKIIKDSVGYQVPYDILEKEINSAIKESEYFKSLT